MLHRLLIVAMMLAPALSHGQAVQGPEVDPQMLEQIRGALRQNPYRKDMDRKARTLVDMTNSEAYQRKLNDMIGQVFPEQAKARRMAMDSGERMYLFVSSSMPDLILRRYAFQMESVPGAQMVMRGFIGGARKIKPTIRFMSRILKKDKNCDKATCERINTPLIIDPVLFRRYGIDRVPALVIVDGLQTDGQCSEGNADRVSIASKVISFGDAPIQAHLERMKEEGSALATKYLEYYSGE